MDAGRECLSAASIVRQTYSPTDRHSLATLAPVRLMYSRNFFLDGADLSKPGLIPPTLFPEPTLENTADLEAWPSQDWLFDKSDSQSFSSSGLSAIDQGFGHIPSAVSVPLNAFATSSACLDMARFGENSFSSSTLMDSADVEFPESASRLGAAEVYTSDPVCGAGLEPVHPHNFEDAWLVELRVAQNLPWKSIADHFQTRFGRRYSVSALQMRFCRLRRRQSTNVCEPDLLALLDAHDYWETKRWHIISEKMNGLDCSKIWTPKACSSAWQRLTSKSEVDNRRDVTAPTTAE